MASRMVRPTEMLAGEPDDRIAGAADRVMLGLGEPPLGEVGQLEIVEEHVEEFLARQDEAERVLALALAGAVGACRRPRAGGGMMSPSTNFLLPGSTWLPTPPLPR